MSSDAVDGAVSILREAQNVGVVSHIDPDGDAVASLIAVSLLLQRIGKQARSLQARPIPDFYDFLPGYELIAKGPDLSGGGMSEAFDCLIALDCPNPSRFSAGGRIALNAVKVVMNIDHHKDNERFGDVNIVDGSASSTAELLFPVIERFGLASDRAIATNLFCGMSTDTGSFSYSNTTPGSLRIAAKLVEAGVDVAWVTRNLQANFSVARMAFLGRVLASIRSTEDGSIVWLMGTRAMRRESGFWGSTEQFANFAMRVRSAQVALLFLEEEQGEYKVSIRSRGQIDAGRLAALYGGGGHCRAAGCRVKGSIETIVSEMVSVVQDRIGQAESPRGATKSG